MKPKSRSEDDVCVTLQSEEVTTTFNLNPSVPQRSSARGAKRRSAPPPTPHKKKKTSSKKKVPPKSKSSTEDKTKDPAPEHKEPDEVPENNCVTCGVWIPHTAQVCSYDCCLSGGSPLSEFFVPSTPPPLRRSDADFRINPPSPATPQEKNKLTSLGDVLDIVNKLDDLTKLAGEQQKEISRLGGVCQGLTRDISSLIGDIQHAANESSRDMWKEYDRVTFSTDRKLSVMEDTFRESVQKLEEKILDVEERTLAINDVIDESNKDATSYTNQMVDDTINKITAHIDREARDIILQTQDQMLSPDDVRAIIKEYRSCPSPTWSDGDTTEVPGNTETTRSWLDVFRDWKRN